MTASIRARCLSSSFGVARVVVVFGQHGEHAAVLAGLGAAIQNRTVVADKVAEIVVDVRSREVELPPREHGRRVDVERVLKAIVFGASVVPIQHTIFWKRPVAGDHRADQGMAREVGEPLVGQSDLHAGREGFFPAVVERQQIVVETGWRRRIGSRGKRVVGIEILRPLELVALDPADAIPDRLDARVAVVGPQGANMTNSDQSPSCSG